MSDLDPLQDLLREILNLRNEGRLSEALQFAEKYIEKAQADNQVFWVEALTGFALLVAESTGDVDLVRQYAERVYGGQPERPAAKARYLFTIADVLFRNGDTDSAKRYAAMSYALVAHGDTETEKSLRELILSQWPEVTGW